MLVIYPTIVRQLNHRLEADLGSNPKYNWRWSEDLLHVMEIIDPDTCKTQYVESLSPEGLTVLSPKTEVRKLLPDHFEQWIVCALIEVNENDGSLAKTGKAAWVPVSSAVSGPVCLLTGEVPTTSATEKVIAAVRATRVPRFRDYEIDYEDRQRKREKQHWHRVYDEIRDAGTAFCGVPGKKGSTSYPLVTLH